MCVNFCSNLIMIYTDCIRLTASDPTIELESDYRLNRIEFLTIRLEFQVGSGSEVKVENRVGLKSRDREIEPENWTRLEIILFF